MKIIARTHLLAFAVSLAMLATCGGSDDKAVGTKGTADASTGGTDAGTGVTTQDAGMGGAGASATATKNVKAVEGGTITADGLAVRIPPGALMTDTDITVAIADGARLPGAATLVGKVYELGPTGTKFLKPVSITIDFDAVKLVSPKVPAVAFLEAGAWVVLADSATTGTKATATTTHFTPFSVVSTDPVVANCVGMAKVACQACCKTTFASGEAKLIPSILQTCGCTAGAACNTQCGPNACMGMPVSDACKTCMSAEGSMSRSVCFNQGLTACLAMDDCKAYVTCNGSCK